MATEDRKQKIYPEEEVAQLVRSLDRKEDGGLFSQDVLLTYPKFTEEYTKMCPKRSDLATAAQKAERGEYSYDARLTPLREEIQLMVNNCRRFNGPTSQYASIADRFDIFAREEIDAYIARKTGGRRASTLRIVSTGDAAAAAGTRGGKSNKNNNNITTTNNNTNANNNNNRNTNISVSGGRGAQEERWRKRPREDGAAPAAAAAVLPVTAAELVKLIDSLDHPRFKGAFRADVGEIFPELRESYEQTCPEKMYLNLARERAANGYYTQQPTPPPQSQSLAKSRRGQQQQQQQEQQQEQEKGEKQEQSGSSVPLFGDSVADSLTLLRRDVELMVSNCIRFNEKVPTWVDTAHSFQRFAHSRIDDFVLRHAPALSGTRSGVAAFVTAPLRSSQTETSPQLLSPAQSAPLQQTPKAQERTPKAQERPLQAQAQAQAQVQAQAQAQAHVRGKERVAAARAAANVSFTSRVALTVQPTPLQPPLAPPDALRQRVIADHLHKETLRARLIRSGGSKEENAEAKAFPPELSGRAALNAFIASVHDFFRSQRARQDFVDPFEYTQQEEQFYADCAALIEQQFERLFPHALLYSQERVDVFEWRAMKALRCAARAGGAVPATRWLDEAHLCYLVRFLVHFPQLMGLACATSVAPSEPNTKPALQLTVMAKGVIDKLAKITDELLAFIARYEAKQNEQPVIQENESEKQENEKVVNEALASKEEKVNKTDNGNEMNEVCEEEETREL